ncbi:MAG: hypothetical protein D8M58_08955 [Calditrichaeota bacterium]|nr:MAG: hypothetical protein DWQ03_17535 [Calditrichota bacterium]MBL1205513.1 hypothetical protein [Calditrichota bacterium]NOG45341.1 OmpA family protein [Calditrichota bacterium]
MRSSIILFLFLSAALLFGQSANDLFDKGNYSSAISAYQRTVDSNPAGYLNLAKSHIALKQFDEAIDALQNYKAKYSSADKTYADKMIALLERDDDFVKIENLGLNVNSAGSEVFPRISQDGNTLYFIASDRTGGVGASDSWYSTKDKNGKWGKGVNFGSPLNTSSNDGLLAISGDDNVAIFFGHYQGTFGGGDLFYTVRQGNGWSDPCNLGATINSDGWESMANLAPDGRTLFFTSSRSGGVGDEDIYVTSLTPNGWTKPANLGSTINTTKKEKYPFLSADGKTLYFSSDGHIGFGGQDLFYSKKLGDSWTSWSEPVNMGKHINTLENDQDLTIPASGVRGYVVKNNLSDGHGKTDIYSFVLPYEMRPEPVFQVYGTVQDDKGNPVAAVIRYQDLDTNEEIARATSNRSDGLYKIALPAHRRYAISIDMKGYLYYSDLLDLRNPDDLLEQQTINQLLSKEVQNIRKAQSRFNELNGELNLLLQKDSKEVSQAFAEYQKLSTQFRDNSRNLNTYVKRAKMEWLSSEDDQRELRKDYVLQPIKVGAKLELKNVYFDFGKASLRPESKNEINKLFDLMNRAGISVEIGGHTDNVGSDQTNLRLSQSRVDEVKKYLVQKGMAQGRVSAVGYGEKHPIATNDTDAGRQANRRVEMKITNIQQREGTDEVKEEIKYDMLALLRHAAIVGGLPEDSPCSNRVASSGKKTETRKTPVKQKTVQVSAPAKELELDDNIYGGWNIHLLNYGFKNADASLGVGIVTADDDLDEYHLEYYFDNPKGVSFMAGLGALYTVQFNDIFNINLNGLFGVDGKFYSVEVLKKDEGRIFVNIPLGFRYIHNFDDLILGYDAIYNINVLKSEEIPNSLSPSNFRVGANVRWKVLQGGLFLNSGDFVDYFGFRAGVAF